MKNLLKNLKNYKLQIIFILAVLMVQAYCDMALPRYTQNIIDIGIFNYGYEGAVPEGAVRIRMTAAGENERLIESDEWNLEDETACD